MLVAGHPSDFPLVALTQTQVDHIVGDGRAVEDIVGLAPMQSLFLTTSATGNGDVGFEQWRYEINGAIDTSALRRAWQSVVDRHQILRVGFETEGLETPVQVIRRRLELPFIEHDWRQVSADQQEARLRVLLESDRATGFRVQHPPLMRITLVRTRGTRVHDGVEQSSLAD